MENKKEVLLPLGEKETLFFIELFGSINQSAINNWKLDVNLLQTEFLKLYAKHFNILNIGFDDGRFIYDVLSILSPSKIVPTVNLDIELYSVCKKHYAFSDGGELFGDVILKVKKA